MVRDYFNNRSPTKYTTPFCFYETLTVLKVKWIYRKEISKDDYTDAAFALAAWFESASRYIRDIDFTNPSVFAQVHSIAQRHFLDLSDAFQILSVKAGFYSALASDSRTILVTADEKLAKAAELEGVKSWYCLGEPDP